MAPYEKWLVQSSRRRSGWSGFNLTNFYTIDTFCMAQPDQLYKVRTLCIGQPYQFKSDRSAPVVDAVTVIFMHYTLIKHSKYVKTCMKIVQNGTCKRTIQSGAKIETDSTNFKGMPC